MLSPGRVRLCGSSENRSRSSHCKPSDAEAGEHEKLNAEQETAEEEDDEVTPCLRGRRVI